VFQEQNRNTQDYNAARTGATAKFNTKLLLKLTVFIKNIENIGLNIFLLFSIYGSKKNKEKEKNK